MKQKILVNAVCKEEIRLAIVENDRLMNLKVYYASNPQYKSNIYLGVVSRVEPSLEAVFVDYGFKRQGFLSIKELPDRYFSSDEPRAARPAPKISEDMLRSTVELVQINEEMVDSTGERQAQKRKRVDNLTLKSGDPIIVQVLKEERGTKGAALTAFVSIPSRFLVYLPDNPESGGISRSIQDEDRRTLAELAGRMSAPEDAGFIIRSAGVGKTLQQLQQDLDYMVNLWRKLVKLTEKENPTPGLLIAENDVTTQLLRDYIREEVDEVYIDDKEMFDFCKTKAAEFLPEFVGKIHYHNHAAMPLFSFHNIERQVQQAYQNHLVLPSGATMVIDVTEALVAVDINSAKATSGSDIEETALKINLEAAQEIANQLRIRDLGGLIVIDFIDMQRSENQSLVEQTLSKALSEDRARTQMGRLSKFGLLEMSRQRLGTSLRDAAGVPCPRCQGAGRVPTESAAALNILRLCEEILSRQKVLEILIETSYDLASDLLNEKRDMVMQIERDRGVSIKIQGSAESESPNYKILVRGSDGELKLRVNTKKPPLQASSAIPSQKPLINQALFTEKLPTRSFLSRLWAALSGGDKPKASTGSKPRSGNYARRGGGGSQSRGGSGGGQGSQGGGNGGRRNSRRGGSGRGSRGGERSGGQERTSNGAAREASE